MPRLKGLRVTRKVTGEYEVLPLYHAKGGATLVGGALKMVGNEVLAAAAGVIAKLLARKELRG